MPSLENLKKQAKLILRWHREKYFPAAAEIRVHLARYRDCSDIEILARPFKLADAQEIVARQNGFKTWSALIAGLPIMTQSTKTNSTKATLVSAEPQLFVTDIASTCAFFTEKLGFSIAFLYGEPPFYGQVKRDGAALNLRCVPRALWDVDLTHRKDYLAASINVDDVKTLFLEFQANGVTFHQTLRKEPWGATTFIVADPDGSLLLFA